jgi:hypothetical protein
VSERPGSRIFQGWGFKLTTTANGREFGSGLGGKFGEDFYAGAGAYAAGSGGEHGGSVGEGADASGGFDAGTGSGYSAEDGDVVYGGSAVGEAGAGFEEVGSCGESDFGGAEFFFEGEEAGFEDDFDDGSGVVG